MMTLREPRKARRENIVPMINVSFLLLIFFLLSAVIASPPPVEIEHPEAEGTVASQEAVNLFLTASGELLSFDGHPVEATAVKGAVIQLHVSAEHAAKDVAGVLRRLETMQPTSISLVARQRPLN